MEEQVPGRWDGSKLMEGPWLQKQSRGQNESQAKDGSGPTGPSPPPISHLPAAKPQKGRWQGWWPAEHGVLGVGQGAAPTTGTGVQSPFQSPSEAAAEQRMSQRVLAARWESAWAEMLAGGSGT